MAFIARLIITAFLFLSSQYSFAAIQIGGKQYVVVPSLFRTDGHSSTDNESRLASCQIRATSPGCVGSLQGGDPYYGTHNATGCRGTCTSGFTNTFVQSLVCPTGATFMTDPTDSNKWKCLKEVTIPECGPNQQLDDETNTCVCRHGPAGAFSVAGDVMTGCNDGCTIYLTSGSYSKTTNKTYGSWNQNGNICAPSPEIPGVDSPDSQDGQDAGKCPTGQCPGTFNGQFMCVPCKGKESSESSSSENTTETPNGASAPAGSASQAQSGSKSTECDGGVCTTKETVVTRNPDGSTTEKQKETTESISDYCAKNPKAAICKTEDAGQWGGACAGGFQCKGDAVQCAQAQAAWKAACLFDVASDDPNVVKGGQAMSSDQSALRAQLGLDGTGDDFNLSSMIDSDPLFAAGGGCPSDQQVTLLGQSLTLSLSSWCSWLQTAGTILQAAAYLAAALIVFRRG